ncbi:MAG: hypothetical protein H0W53_22800 [Acidobacteria bacterium]|nr:hypothetical protein [Acidobacteriota bacterium]
MTEEILPATAAAAFQRKAVRIAESLKLALYFRLPTTPGSPAAFAVTAS